VGGLYIIYIRCVCGWVLRGDVPTSYFKWQEKVQDIQIQMTLGLKVPMLNKRIPNGLGKG